MAKKPSFRPLKGILLFLLVITGCGTTTLPQIIPPKEETPILRVLIRENIPRANIIFPQNFIFKVGSYQQSGKGRVTITIESNAIVINGIPLSEPNCAFISEEFSIGNTPYKGNLIVFLSNNTLFLINEIDIETYLYSVVASEVPAQWPREALKAQAVAARTYALYEMVSSRQKNLPFDVYADTRSQVYKGENATTKATYLAVDETRGEILRYNGRIIPAYFHASSGGFTENSEEVFGVAWPYLRGVASPYAQIYSNEWKIEIPLSNFSRSLNLATIKKIDVLERTPSQRIRLVQITDEAGRVVQIPGTNLRNIIGPTVMRSTRANIRLEEEKLIIYGVGYGHGVGMAQWDAYGMALAGKDYREILRFFYTGVQIDKLW